MPRPVDLHDYDVVLPGAADRILKMAEDAAETRNEALRTTTKAEVEYAQTGQVLAFLFTGMAFVAAIVFFALKMKYAGTAFLSVPVLMLIRSFLKPMRSSGQDTDD